MKNQRPPLEDLIQALKSEERWLMVMRITYNSEGFQKCEIFKKYFPAYIPKIKEK